MAMDLQRLTSLLRQCMQRYDMVSAGDKIAVGLSGGKDSLTRAARQTWRRCGSSAKD